MMNTIQIKIYQQAIYNYEKHGVGIPLICHFCVCHEPGPLSVDFQLSHVAICVFVRMLASYANDCEAYQTKNTIKVVFAPELRSRD